MKLFIDDERYAPPGYDALAKTNEMAIATLEGWKEDKRVKFELISLDYDAHNYLNWTFEPTLQWMADNDYWPDEIRIHTFNSWDGRPWIEKFLKEHAPKSTVVDLTDPWTYDFYHVHPDDDKYPEWVHEFLEAQHR